MSYIQKKCKSWYSIAFLPLHDVLWDYNLFLRVAPAEMSLPFHNGMSYKSLQLLHEGWLCLAILLGSNGCGLISNPPPENIIIQIIIIIIRRNTYILRNFFKKEFLSSLLKIALILFILLNTILLWKIN